MSFLGMLTSAAQNPSWASISSADEAWAAGTSSGLPFGGLKWTGHGLRTWCCPRSLWRSLTARLRNGNFRELRTRKTLDLPAFFPNDSSLFGAAGVEDRLGDAKRVCRSVCLPKKKREVEFIEFSVLKATFL